MSVLGVFWAFFKRNPFWDDVCHPPSPNCDLHREVHWYRPCGLGMCNTVNWFTNESNTCARLKVGVPKSLLHWLYPLPATLYNLASQNSGLSTNFKSWDWFREKLGISKKLCWCLVLGNLGCSMKSTKNKLVVDVGTSEHRVITFGLSGKRGPN